MVNINFRKFVLNYSSWNFGIKNSNEYPNALIPDTVKGPYVYRPVQIPVRRISNKFSYRLLILFSNNYSQIKPKTSIAVFYIFASSLLTFYDKAFKVS